MLHKKKMTARSLFRYPLGNQRPSGRRAEWLVIKKRKCSTKKDDRKEPISLPFG